MEDNFVKVMPDKEKAKSILKMVDITLEMINNIDKSKFPSNITKEYYEVLRELISVIILLDGYKTIGEGAHKRMIEYLESNYKQFDRQEISLIDNLRIIRNQIAYEGFFVKEEYIERKADSIHHIVKKLKEAISKKM